MACKSFPTEWKQRRGGGIIVMIEEIHGRPTKAGDSFSAAHIVGYFDTIDGPLTSPSSNIRMTGERGSRALPSGDQPS